MEKKIFSTTSERIDTINELLSNTQIDSIINYKNNDDNGEFNLLSDDIRELLPKKFIDFTQAIEQLGGKLLYFKSGSTGHTFKGVYPDINKNSYAVKIVAYPKRENYGDMYNIKRPENAELLMITLLSQFVINKQTPHIVLPITTFNTSIKPFLSLSKKKCTKFNRY
jgi:hypothetical protein